MSLVRFITDEDFNGRIARGLSRRKLDLDLIRVQDIGLAGAADGVIVQWAEEHDRLLLTHDARTMPQTVRERVYLGASSPGIVVVDNRAPVGICIEHLLLVAECSEAEEWRDQIVYLPWR